MPATYADRVLTGICLYREARGEGNNGMLAVACVIRNRVIKHTSTFYTEVIKPWQFTSISVKGDPQLALWPKETDPLWLQAQLIAGNVIDGGVQDITSGATLYWNPNGITEEETAILPFKLNDGTSVAFPRTWNPAAVTETVKIGNHIFLKEN